MIIAIKDLLSDNYQLGRSSSLVVSEINNGENISYLIRAENDDQFVLRQYRRNRYNHNEIEAELQWIKRLQDKMNVPIVVNNKDGEPLTFVKKDEDVVYYVLFEFIDGHLIEQPSEDKYRMLGKIMSTLHEETSVTKEHKDDLFQARPHYNMDYMVNESVNNLLQAPFLTKEDKKRAENILHHLQSLYTKYIDYDHQFVHGDMHFGNIIVDESKFYLLDFDECGYSHHSFDLGVPRLHLIASDGIKKYWQPFLDGYNLSVSEGEIRVGAALRLLFMTGKIPHRLDIPQLSKDPQKGVRTYFSIIEKELSGEYAI